MLYENEKIKLWDPETNEMSGTDEVIDEEVRRIIDEGYSLIALKNSNGWQLLENLLKTTCSDLKEKLTYEQDLERFRRLQEAVKAYQNVLNFVDYKIAEGRALEDQQKNQSPE
jgi:hypothetical protein